MASEESDLAALKAKRKTCRGKLTKAIKSAMKFTSDNLAEIKQRELREKIEIIKRLMDEHSDMHEAVLTQMATEGKPQLEIDGEVSGNEAVERISDSELDKLEEASVLSNLYLGDVRVQTNAATWVKESKIEAPTFNTDGNKVKEELERNISDLTPYAAHSYINGQLAKAQSLAEQVRTKLFATAAAAPSVLPAETRVERSITRSALPPPYHIKPPTFSGNPRDFKHFCERFEAIMDLHKDYYPDTDKISILADAMKDSDARKLVLNSCSDGYEGALEQLKMTYGRKTVIYPQLVDEFLKKEKYDCSRESMKLILDKTKRLLSEMEKIGGRNIDTLAVALTVKEFDMELMTEWSKHLGSNDELPTLEKLIEFVTPLSHNLPRLSRNVYQSHKPVKQHHHSSTTPASIESAVKVESKSEVPPKRVCPACKESSHPLYRCVKFKDMTVNQRWNLVNKNKHCSNCLHPSHQAATCTSKYTCKFCKQPHNYLLHKESEEDKKSTNSGITLAAQTTQTSPETDTAGELGCGFIFTALVSIQSQGRKINARAALDSCATHSLISEEVAAFLQPQRQPIKLTMRGAVAEKQIKHWATVNISTIIPSEFDVPLGVAIVNDLPPATPPKDGAAVAKNPMLNGLTLADPYFGGKLDLIIGTNDLPMLWGNDGRKFSMADRLTAVNTAFGWVVSGSALPASKSGTSLRVEVTEDRDHQLFQKMYELEKVPEAIKLTPEEESAITQFKESIVQTVDGRYAAKLPRVESPPQLGNSSKMALSRMISNERKMKKVGKLAEFDEEMFGYIRLEHAEVVPESERDKGMYYLPVKGVIKESSTSTKVRPVFDASAKTSNGVALNDAILVGPNLYPLISDILIQFRSYPIAVSADISKMYREVKLLPEDQAYHFLYIRDPDGKLLTCKMKRLTFGVRPSPFIATSVIRHHSNQNQKQYPKAAQAIMQQFYVDDFLSGASTLDEAVQIREELCKLLSLCGMKLRKWRSNSQQLLSTIPDDLLEKEDKKELIQESPLKALGIHWDTSKDTLLVTTPTSEKGEVTKRVVARVVASVYDVLGLMSPYLISGKIVLQQLWVHKLAWDDCIPEEVLPKWQCWVDGLEVVKGHHIDRYTGCHDKIRKKTLHGFSDASQLAYGAVVYLVCESTTGLTSHIICSKARVCPLKLRTIPELELEAAKLLAKLLHHVAGVLNIPLSNIVPWTDSSIVLAWLLQPPNKLKTFVCNRVALIGELLPRCSWRHVPTADNPADMCSRGVTAQTLVNSHLWWNGPDWLKLRPEQWPFLPAKSIPPSQMPGVKATVIVAMATQKCELDLWQRFSCYNKLVRVLAWVLRFLRAYVKKEKQPPDRTLTWNDVNAAKYLLIRVQQLESFPDVFAVVSSKGRLSKGHPLGGMGLELSPNHALLVKGRVGGKSMVPLSAKNALTKLMLLTQHKLHGHPGVATLISIVGHTFYVVGIKRELKRIAKMCPNCQHANANPLSQQMGMLPTSRVTLQPPFDKCGVDFAGPITLKEGATRKPVKFKSYLCLFVCMSTRCVHIEIVKTLETNEFMAALQRFANRRGMPSEIFSDNGSNFIGAAKEINDISSMLRKSKHSISVVESQHGVKWHFNPPRAPHFGGLWEAGVKIMKKQIRKIIEPHPLRLDEMWNITTHVEAVLNSRPLVPLEKVESEDELALTPAHFLIGRPMRAPPTPAASAAKITSLRRWQLVQKLQQQLSEGWSGHYLQSLQSRSKWRNRKENVRVGQIVYIKDITLSNGLKWPLGKIIKVYAGRDNLVRTVDLVCKGKEYKRPIHLLIPLNIEDNDEQ